MKLANLFLITGLVSVLAVIGCAEESKPDGNGGTGGDGDGNGGSGGAEPCTGGECTAGSQAKTDCENFVSDCEAAGAGGAGGNGGAGGGSPIPPEECANLGFAAFCSGGAGGGGGSGGDGGAGGTGPDLGCNVLACESSDELKAQCEEAVAKCLVCCGEGGECECNPESCLGLGILLCNVEQ